MPPCGKTPQRPVSWSLPQNMLLSLQLMNISCLFYPLPLSETSLPSFQSIFILFPSSPPLSSDAGNHQSLLRLAEPQLSRAQSFIVYLPFQHKQSDSPNCPLKQTAKKSSSFNYFLRMSGGKSTLFIVNHTMSLSYKLNRKQRLFFLFLHGSNQCPEYIYDELGTIKKKIVFDQQQASHLTE